MDVRAVDTGSIAAKRIELDKTRPIQKKSHSAMDERLAAKQLDSDDEERKYDPESEEESEDSPADELHFDAQDDISVANPTVPFSEHHELDVRV